MTMGIKIIPAGKFKSQCLALLDDVASTGQEWVVTKRGRPVAKIIAVEQPQPIDGSVIHCGDLISPAIDEGDWEMIPSDQD